MGNLAHILTLDGITVVLHGRPYNISHRDEAYEDIVNLVNKGANESAIEQRLTRTAERVRTACLKLSINIEYNDGVVLYRGEPMHGYAVEKLVELVNNGHDALPLARFLEKLQLNPSAQTIENLYQFLEYGRIPLTHDGNFLAYKAIRKNWKDIHSGTIDNSIGTIVKMPRNKVDDRRDVTCSRGLHVCSFSYLPSFSHADGHVVVCEINPANVVAIPNDYNNTKMRVSEYRVVGEVENYYQENRDVLGGKGVWEPKFAVYLRTDENDEWELFDEFDDDAEAVDLAEELLDEEPEWAEVKIVDQEFGVVIYRNETN